MTALVCLLCSRGNAQDSTSAASAPDCKNGATVHCIDQSGISNFVIDKEAVRSFEPSILERLGRTWQYQYQFSEQPAFVVATVSGSSQIIPNPEAYLQQHEMIFQLSELFPNVSNAPNAPGLPSIVAAIQTGIASNPENKNKVIRLGQLCVGQRVGQPGIRCLASGGRLWERFISGVSGNGSLSERDEVQQGLVTVQSFSQHYGPAGEIDFDPSPLFITGTNWKNAVAALKGITFDANVFEENTDEARCFMKDKADPLPLETCIAKFASSRGASAAASLVPKFQFKVADQYDYLKNGGVLIPVPGLQRSLKSYTFTWDLRHLISSTADRLAVLAAYRSYSSPPASDAVSQKQICVTISGGNRGYVPVADGFAVDSCRLLADGAKADGFALACATSTDMVIGPPNGLQKGQEARLPEANTCKWPVN
jgi:hypothetical protein